MCPEWCHVIYRGHVPRHACAKDDRIGSLREVQVHLATVLTLIAIEPGSVSRRARADAVFQAATRQLRLLDALEGSRGPGGSQAAAGTRLEGLRSGAGS